MNRERLLRILVATIMSFIFVFLVASIAVKLRIEMLRPVDVSDEKQVLFLLLICFGSFFHGRAIVSVLRFMSEEQEQ